MEKNAVVYCDCKKLKFKKKNQLVHKNIIY